MSHVICPKCKKGTYQPDRNFRDTLQCDSCAQILRVVIRDSRVIDVRTREIDLDIPSSLPEKLEQILSEAISGYEMGNYASCVVMSGLFVEGLLNEAQVSGSRLVDMIEKAHEEGLISKLGFHVATASRMLRNIGAHYSPDLNNLSASDARLVLEMSRKLAADVVSAEVLSDGT